MTASPANGADGHEPDATPEGCFSHSRKSCRFLGDFVGPRRQPLRGPLRSDPDYYATAVMNEILSGGFSGRLMNNIRSKAGVESTPQRRFRIWRRVSPSLTSQS